MWLYVHNKLTLAMSSASHSLWKRENYIHHFQLLYFSSAISFSVEERDLHSPLSPPFFLSCGFIFCRRESSTFTIFTSFISLLRFHFLSKREIYIHHFHLLYFSPAIFFSFSPSIFLPPLSFSSSSFHEISKSRKKGGAGSWGGDRGGGVGIDGIFPFCCFCLLSEATPTLHGH